VNGVGNLRYFYTSNYPQLVTGSNPFSVEFFIKPTTYTNQHILSHSLLYDVNRMRGYAIAIVNGKLGFYMSEAIDNTGLPGVVEVFSPLLSTCMPLNTWAHIVVERTNNQSGVAIYINGTSVPVIYNKNNFVTGDITQHPDGSFWVASAQYPGVTATFGGDMKHLRVYSRALPATEVRQNYFNYCHDPVDQNGLVFWEPMNEGSFSYNDPVQGYCILDRIYGAKGQLNGGLTFGLTDQSFVAEPGLKTKQPGCRDFGVFL
jgi:hypothetical protein